MASAVNPNQLGGAAYDIPKLFPPSTPSPSSSPNPQNFVTNETINLNPNFNSAPFAPPSASYPPLPIAGGAPYPYIPQTSPFHPNPQFHHHPMYNPPSDPGEFVNVHPQRSMSYPTPTLQPHVPSTSILQHNINTSPNAQNPNHHGARLMALLSAPPAAALEIPYESTMPLPQINQTNSSGSDFSVSQNVNALPVVSGLAVSHQSPVMRMPSSKLPNGRHLTGRHLVYDIDVRFPEEMQPQLEVTPITKYGSDPGLVLGRQIAVNKTYICYGLKLGAIRVLNINTALRSLLKGLAQRVTDMAFFAEDVHLLACASVDGRVYVWNINESPDLEDKQQITGQIVVAIQVTGEEESVHPRVCWHCHKQEILVVGIGKHILKIDTTKVGKAKKFSAEEPLICSYDRLIDGVQLIGSHDGELTDLSMCQWMNTRLVSASVDGTIKIWEDRKSQPIAVLQPHGCQPVNFVTFLTAPHRPDHVILITGGPLNHEIKIWVAASEEGWLLPIDAESWHCTQTLELQSSEAQTEEAFFNQVVALSQAGLVLLANAKKNAIYVVHLEYGPNPAATRMDYIAEFTVTMSILSFIGTSEYLHQGEQIVQVYCVQTQAIQQYALDLSQCLPPPMGNVVFDKSDFNASHETSGLEGLLVLEPSCGKTTEVSMSTLVLKTSMHESGSKNAPSAKYLTGSTSAESTSLHEVAASSTESKPNTLSGVSNDGYAFSVPSPAFPLSPRLCRTLSGFRNPSSSFEHVAEPKIVEYSVDRHIDAIHSNLSDKASMDDVNHDNKQAQDDISIALNNPINFRHPTHLVTPSEIMMANSSSEVMHLNETESDVEKNIHDVVMNDDARNAVVEVKVVNETRFTQENDSGPHVPENIEKSICSQASDMGIVLARDFCNSSPEFFIEEGRGFDGSCVTETDVGPSTLEDCIAESAVDAAVKSADFSTSVSAQHAASHAKGNKQKRKSAQGSGPSSPARSAFNSTEFSNEPGISYGGTLESQFLSIQEILIQLSTLQKEMHKQMATMVTVPVTKESKRLEASLGRNMEKIVKANTDALWAGLLEENAKREKASQERALQLTNMISSFLHKDLAAIIEKTVKRELSAVGQSVARTIVPVIEKAISTSISESFQKGVGDKAVNQLEKSISSKLEATVPRQIQTQFQTFGRQALQESLKSSFEASVIPAFDASCKTMFEQVDATFLKGMNEHTAAAQQQFEASLSSLALALRDSVNSASSMTQSLSNELLDGQRKLVALAIAGANSEVASPLINQLNNGPLGGLLDEVEVDPTTELSRLMSQHKYEEAFTFALQTSDVSIVSWLCSQVDLPTILAMNPPSFSQGVLLSLLQQLACGIGKDTPQKLTWMREVLTSINPTDSVIAVHVRPIFEQVYQIMDHQRNISSTTGSELSNIRLIIHVLNSMLMSFK